MIVHLHSSVQIQCINILNMPSFVYNMFTKKNRPCQSSDKDIPDFLERSVGLETLYSDLLLTCLHLLQELFVFLANLSYYLELGFTRSPLVSPPRLRSPDLWWSVDGLVKTEVHHFGIWMYCKILYLAANNIVS